CRTRAAGSPRCSNASAGAPTIWCTTRRRTRSPRATLPRGRPRPAPASVAARRATDVLRAFRVPLTWMELFKRTIAEAMADNCLNLAAQLAYYFFLALFPALLVLLAIISFFPVHDLMNTIVATLGRIAPVEVLEIIRDQITKIASGNKGGLLTLGVLGAIWSSSSAITAIVSALNEAYDIREGRPWWKVRLIAIALTVTLAIF